MDELKTCKTCGKEKNIEEFPIERNKGIARRRPRCRECFLIRKRELGKAERVRRGDEMRAYEAEYRKNNQERLKKIYNKWREKNPGKHLEHGRKSRHKHRKKRNEASRTWEKNNPEKYKAIRKRCVEKRKRLYPENAIVERVKKSIRAVIKKQRDTQRKDHSTIVYTGCSSPIDFCVKMNQKTNNPNWVGDGYQIDHIMQINWFREFIDANLDKVEEICMIFSHHSNLRPLSREENLHRSLYDFFGCEELIEKNREYLNKSILVKFDFYMKNRHLFNSMILKCSKEEDLLKNFN